MARSISISIFAVLFLFLAWSTEGANVLSITPVSRTGLISCRLRSDGCYQRCTQFCAPGRCSPETCASTCFEKGCGREKERVCSIKCSGSGSCWKRCRECCYRGTKKCEPQPCAAVCLPPNCGRPISIGSPIFMRPTPSPSPRPLGRCSPGCKRGSNSSCYLRCSSRRNSRGICTITNVCNRRCFRRGCGLTPTPPKKCEWTCTGSGGCYARCRKCCDSEGVCTTGICQKACFPRGCGLKPAPAKKCKWTCRRSGGCYVRCRTCCNSDGVCTAGGCLKACYQRGCGLKPLSTTNPSPRKCAWGCKRSRNGRCYSRCREFVGSDGVCAISDVCNRRCYGRGCGLNLPTVHDPGFTGDDDDTPFGFTHDYGYGYNPWEEY